MEKNSQYDELLIKYLADDVNAGEKEFVENWVNATTENRHYFESLKTAWQLAGAKRTLDYVLDEMDVDDKWNRFRQSIAAKETKVISINEQEQVESEYPDEENPDNRPIVYRLLVSVAIAASVLLVIGLGWMLFGNNKPETPVAQNTEKKADSLTFVVRHEMNTTGKEKRIQLSDGSLIVLADKSEITYREPFTDKRDITLIGKSFFKVAKDETKPFTVFSGDISTTALGTEFTITASPKNNQVIVRLYEGKVVVKAVDKRNKKLKKDIYLLPGQAFVYGNQTTANVKAFKIDATAAPEQIMKQERPLDNPSLPENEERPYFMFNNQPLGEVFDNLAGLYNVTIVYDKKEVQNLSFIGKYSTSDSLETILKRIAILNDLTLTKTDNAYIISR